MTTVAFKNGVMVCDGQISDETSIQMNNFCKIKWCGHLLVGLAGDLADFKEVWKWFLAGHPLKKSPRGDWEALVWDTENNELSIWEASGKPIILPTGNYAAVGSGSVPAQVAMYCGKGALQAVRIAVQHDSHTGGEIFQFKVSDVPVAPTVS